MCAEFIWLYRVQSLGHSVFPKVVRARTLAGRPNAVAPVVTVRETAPGPAKIGSTYASHVVNELFADAADVWDLRITAYPNTVIDDTAEVFDKMAIYVRVYFRPGLGRIDFDLGIGNRQWAKSRTDPNPSRGSRFKESPPVHWHHSLLVYGLKVQIRRGRIVT